MAVKVKIQLDADVDRLANQIQRATAKGFQGGGSAGLATSPAEFINKIVGGGSERRKSIIQSERFLQGGADRLRAMGELEGVKHLGKFSLAPEWYLKQGAQRLMEMGDFNNPTGKIPPIIAPPVIPGSGGGGFLGGVLSKMGFGSFSGGAAGIAATVVALTASFKALERVVKEVMDAFSSARKLYAHSLMSGMGLPFTTMRMNLASVIGVDERELFRFGANLAVLAPRLQWANRTMSDSAREAGSVGQEIEILKTNFKALFMEIAADLAPAIRKVIAGLAGLVEALGYLWKQTVEFIKGIALAFHIPKASDLLSALTGMSPTAAALIKAFLSGASKYDIGALPGPQNQMKQLPVSALERMGLVIGGFGAGADFARRTAVATEKTVRLLERGFGGGGGTFGDPLYNAP